MQVNSLDMHPKPLFDHGKNYKPLSQHYREKFGEKVYKVSVSIADSCPNREGKNGMDVCVFCDEWGSAAYHLNQELSIEKQIHLNQEAIRKRYKANKFLIYFQSYTNTFGRFKDLENVFLTATNEDDVLGLVIGTRPDCLPQRVLDLFSRIAQQHYLSVELGVQTFDDGQLKFLSRGHDSLCSENAIKKLKQLEKVNLCVHLMFGLPGENEEQIIATAKHLSELGVDGVKLHNLHVLKNTPLEKMYHAADFVPIELEEYTEKVTLFLENLSPDIAIHRLTAVASRWDELVAPAWTKEKMRPTQFVEDNLASKKTWQGRCYVEKDASPKTKKEL